MTTERYGYGDAGHPFDPDRYGRCRMASGGYCDGTRGDSMHERRVISSFGADRDQLTGAHNPETDVRDPLTGEWHTRARRG